jgi:hypothetical protein
MKKPKKPIGKSARAIEKLRASGVPVEDLTSQGGAMGFLGGVKKPSK